MKTEIYENRLKEMCADYASLSTNHDKVQKKLSDRSMNYPARYFYANSLSRKQKTLHSFGKEIRKYCYKCIDKIGKERVNEITSFYSVHC